MANLIFRTATRIAHGWRFFDGAKAAVLLAFCAEGLDFFGFFPYNRDVRASHPYLEVEICT